MHSCCVPGCYNRSSDKTLRFHRFPEDKELRRQWIVAVNRKAENSSYKHFTPKSGSHRVCSAHFVDGVKSIGSVPSIFPNRKYAKKPATPRQSRAIQKRNLIFAATPKRRKTKSNTGPTSSAIISTPPKTSQPLTRQTVHQLYRSGHLAPEVGACEEVITSTSPKPTTSQPVEHSYSCNAPICFSPAQHSVNSAFPNTKASSLTIMQSLSSAKVETKALKTRIMDIDNIKQDPSLLDLYTGFTDKSHFNALIAFLSPDSHNFILPSGERFSNSLSLENSVLLTLTKYKLDTPQEDLAFRFGIKQSEVARIVTAYTDLMYRRFREIPIWPSRELIQQHMPDAFKDKYNNTRVVIDCIEMFIQCPSAASVQQLTSLSWKSHNTAKALVGITPNCFISFIPDIQAGKLSDKELVRQSGLVELLEPEDLVMADRNFTIEDLRSNSVPLNICQFLHQKPQCEHTELIATKSVAAVRIHAERVIGRIRRYRILCSTFPDHSLSRLNKIWVNCCYLTNLQHTSLRAFDFFRGYTPVHNL